MPEPLSELAYSQIGVEVTPGTPVAANRKILSWGISPSYNPTFDEFTAQGYSDPTIVALSREEGGGEIDGRASYTDIVYLLSMILNTATITTPAGATAARQWVFEQNPTGISTPVAITHERSNGALNERYAGQRLASLDLDFSGENVTVSGTLIGEPPETGITMTAAPTVIDVVPIMRSHISVYIDEPGANQAAWDTAFGTTKLTRARVGSFSIGDRFSTWYGHDAAAGAGPIVTLERRGTKEIAITMFRDAVAADLLATTRAGDIRQLRVEAVGPLIETGTPNQYHTLLVDLAVQAVGGFGPEDDEGAEVTTVTFRPVYSGTWQRATRATVVNRLTAL